jgi:hypothetical protein
MEIDQYNSKVGINVSYLKAKSTNAGINQTSRIKIDMQSGYNYYDVQFMMYKL